MEWKVDISKAGEEPEIIFEVEARSLLRGSCEIKIEEKDVERLYGVQFVDLNDNKMKGISCRVIKNGEKPNGYYLLCITGKNENRVLKFQKV